MPQDPPSPSAEPCLLHGYFEAALLRWPERSAVEVPPGPGRPERRSLSYEELDRRSRDLAGALGPKVGAERVVAILLPRDLELYVAQLGVLRAGVAYTCIDPSFPDEQVRDILEDAEAVALLTDGPGAARARGLGTGVEVIEVPTGPGGGTVLPAAPWLGPESLAYLIYTSGTTGRPKGVMIEHRAIANLVGSDIEAFGLGPGDRVAQGSSPSYDSSLEEIWLAWAVGATVVVLDDQAARLGPDLVAWLRSERISVLCPPPTLLRTMGCADPRSALPDLRLLYVGGEALPRDVADHWASGRRLVNGYGPTECAVTSVRTDILEGGPISIGRPVRGLRAWVLDEALEEVPEGQQGELCLGGIGLARGYRHRPELTAEKFPVHPRFGRIYRTGDLVSRDGEGVLHCFGRIDAQVKLRGYRIELEAVEARLAECPGVREAACRVQGEGPQALLVAFVVPERPEAPPDFEALRAALARVLPAYMVPARLGILEALPTTVGGKLDRRALPEVEAQAQAPDPAFAAPRTPLELLVAEAFAKVLPGEPRPSLHQDFFKDLGGDSLSAALVVSRLRERPEAASVTVRDLYEARTLEALARRLHAEGPPPEARAPRAPGGNPVLATALQAAWLLVGLMLGGPAAYLLAFRALPWLTRGLGLGPFLLLGPLLGFAGACLYAGAAVALTVGVKRVLVGRYRAGRSPLWGSFHVRHWMVQQTARIIPWALLEGTDFEIRALRALGARIGARVHLHRGVNLRMGGWDLLDIGDDASLGQDALVRLVDLEDGELVVGPVVLGPGATLEVRAGVDGHTELGAGAYLTALSSLSRGSRIPAGECWSGVPARPAGRAPDRPEAAGVELSPGVHGLLLLGAKLVHLLLLSLPLELGLLAAARILGVDTERALAWFRHPSLEARVLGGAALVALVSGPLTLLLEAAWLRALGPVREGVIPRWSPAYLRVWIKAGSVLAAGEWLSGTLFWPPWLRLAGMRVGRGCEISTILDVVPELVEIGPETFFADGIYLGGPRVHRGAVSLGRLRLGRNTFLGNHVVVPGGQELPDDVLVGVSTVAEGERIRPGTSWFGHPPFELPRREVVAMDRSLTHDPSWIRYGNRLFWEALRFALPVPPLLVFALWAEGLAWAEARCSGPLLLLGAAPLASLAVGAAFCLLILVLKWGLLGRVRPGQHPLWSCWCSRWDFLYVAWGVYGRGSLSSLEGSLLLSVYLRAMGVRIGRRVALGPGFAQVVDPDMLHFEDGATVSALFQAHTFEDRVLKIDHVLIRRGASVGPAAVLLYGADVGERAWVGPHSVVMKRERLLPDHDYEGCPTRPEARPRAEGPNERGH